MKAEAVTLVPAEDKWLTELWEDDMQERPACTLCPWQRELQSSTQGGSLNTQAIATWQSTACGSTTVWDLEIRPGHFKTQSNFILNSKTSHKNNNNKTSCKVLKQILADYCS